MNKNMKYFFLILILVLSFLIGYLSTMSIWKNETIPIEIQISQVESLNSMHVEVEHAVQPQLEKTLQLTIEESSRRQLSTTSLVNEEVVVLLYHHILKDEENPYENNYSVISYNYFEDHLKYLSENGYTTISLKDLEDFLYNQTPLPKKSVLITFDDGYLSNFTYAFPLLAAYGMQGVVFPITHAVEEKSVVFDPNKRDKLSWGQIGVTDDVFEYGSHTHNLHQLIYGQPAIFAFSDKTIREDLLTSMELLNTTAVAYPFGAYDEATIDIVKELGYKLGFTTKEGRVTQETDPYEIPRYGMFSYTSVKVLEDILDNKQ
ncbi:polysaccharide deacetylase family protein [Vallitalea okinawensis]|uniref:polysaccharide deacetylase family protein n=1 Tax=Vallitalea okinawensis TaxID=2078660 RepID=UPI000CFBBB03|nr:polysaccharide deacetylase family protein [Vallitalea okinawensis]